jgi:protein TonB
MHPFAFSRGQGSVYAELPPTLQPFAIASAAPPVNHLRAAGLSGLIYLLLAAALFASSTLSHRMPPDLLKPTGPERIFQFDPPVNAPRIQLPPAESVRPSGSSDAMASTRALAPAENSDAASSALPTVDHSGDMPNIGHPTTLTPGASREPYSTGTASNPVVHDFSMTGLEVLQRVDPVYPELARRAHVQGTVVLLMTVNEAGQPINVQVLEGHPALQDAATRAARQWRFVPARLEGQSVAASFRLTLKFALR